MAKDKEAAGKGVVVAKSKAIGLTPAEKGRVALKPSLNAAAVIEAYQGNILGSDGDMNTMIDGLRETFAEVRGSDLHTMEAMLISQATALQTIFTSLARRAQVQTQQRHLEAFLGLALKAQAQSRATISALVDLKYPKQATFVKQANIANGPQQINNGAGDATRTEQKPLEQNKLLEVQHGQPGGWMDTGTTQAAKRSHQAVEAVGAVQRAKNIRRKSSGLS